MPKGPTRPDNSPAKSERLDHLVHNQEVDPLVLAWLFIKLAARFSQTCFGAQCGQLAKDLIVAIGRG